MKNQRTDDTAQSALQRDPDEWKTGDEPMTDAQRFYLETLCRETGEDSTRTVEGRCVEAHRRTPRSIAAALSPD
jgi:Protein of unknown function (DUF3072)